jgi:hypothetical protein
MQPKAYRVDDIPAYEFDPKAERPWRDEDVAMSAPRNLAKDQSFESACEVAADHMTGISTMNHVVMSGEQGIYAIAAAFFAAAKTRRYPADLSIQISGRVLRVVEQKA